ncbi:MAG TPA: DUF4157 domain-containing protein [Kofleriaceae bacterium]|nr:DUF4157 domain-containing protein [Kofleriaceae bacterium]
MSQAQQERNERSSDQAAPSAATEPKPGGQTADAGAQGASPAAGEPASGGEAAAQVGAEGGGEGGEAGAWEADAGLMDAMGLGGGGGGEAGDGEAGEKKKKRKAKAAPASASTSAAGEGISGGAEGGGLAPEGGGKPGGAVQHLGGGGGGGDGGAAGVHETAAAGISGAGGALPHLDAIQQSFGGHDVSGVSAHTDGAAASANERMGSEAYATGDDVAFGSSSPSLHTAAHEAAHVVQQRGGVQLKGGVGQVGDAYEQHADAVADQVVQGKSAEGLLDQMAPGGGGGGGGAVQAKVVQFDIKSDLREAMDGWGTDEDAIFRRCERATAAEAQAVLADAALMGELRGELDRGDMTRVLDGLRAPVADKLRLAMNGWGTDEAYIHRTLFQATPAELQAIAADDALVRQLEGELSGDDLKQVLDRLPVPLSRKLRFAIRGWGTDEAYLFRAIGTATLADVAAVANDAGLMAEVDSDLSGDDLHRFRGSLARRLWLEGANGPAAFRACMGDRAARSARLRWLGDVVTQRALLDAVIVAGNPPDMIIQAFQSYWEVETTVVAGATAWNPDAVIAIHRQMKLLPSQDTRAGVWNELQLTGNPDLINRAAWNGSALIVGENIDPATAGTMTMGYGSTLTAQAAVGATTLEVAEGARFANNDDIAVDRTDPSKKDKAKVSSIAGNTLTIDTATTHQHNVGAQVTPDDDSALHQVPYLDATVRHEIAHAVETTLGGVTGFTVGIGGWWTGTDINTWAGQMTNPWTPNDGTTISDTDLQKIKDVITDAVSNRKGSLRTIALSLPADHPLKINIGKAVPAIDAAEACLSRGDQFYQNAGSIYASNGKRFSVSWWYKNFMSHNEDVVARRLADYQLYAPAEYFAEAYTVFYEEAHRIGTPGFSEADLGRLVRNATEREWIRTNVHNRGQAPAPPAGTGATPTPSVAESRVGTARPGAAGYGKKAGNPGP